MCICIYVYGLKHMATEYIYIYIYMYRYVHGLKEMATEYVHLDMYMCACMHVHTYVRACFVCTRVCNIANVIGEVTQGVCMHVRVFMFVCVL